MIKIITFILKLLNTINKISFKLICFLSIYIKPDNLNFIDSKPVDVRYRQFNVDDPAIIEPFKKLETLDYKQLIKDNNIKPIKRQNGKVIPKNTSCSRCNAPHDYLYDNTGKSTQFECKVCNTIFSTNPNPFKDVILKCPHCQYRLALIKERKDFNVYRCCNKLCSFYLKNKNSMNVIDKEKFKNNPSSFKLHYIYRAFNINKRPPLQEVVLK